MKDRRENVHQLIETACQTGADRCDVFLIEQRAISATCRHDTAEGLEHADTCHINLRVFVGNRAATLSTTSLDPTSFKDLSEKAIVMARLVPEDAFTSWVSFEEKGALPSTQLDIVDHEPLPSLKNLFDRAQLTERSALATPGITNSNGASAFAAHTTLTLADSDGFCGSYEHTRHYLGVSVLTGSGTSMQRDFANHSARYLSDLKTPETLGFEAAHRTLNRINSNKPRTGAFPVVFDKRVSASLLGHLATAINGGAIARGTSFLSHRRDTRILPSHLSVCDDPTLVRGLRSRPFDAEGSLSRRLNVVTDGVLVDWLLDSRSAHQLKLQNNGRASRAIGSPPSPAPSNFFLLGGDESFDDLLGDIHEGVFVHELMGSSINGLNSDYSRGACGFMIRDGSIAEPIAEFTIAGNLVDIFINLRAANDLDFTYGVDAPTLRSDCMKVAGG